MPSYCLLTTQSYEFWFQTNLKRLVFSTKRKHTQSKNTAPIFKFTVRLLFSSNLSVARCSFYCFQKTHLQLTIPIFGLLHRLFSIFCRLFSELPGEKNRQPKNVAPTPFQVSPCSTPPQPPQPPGLPGNPQKCVEKQHPIRHYHCWKPEAPNIWGKRSSVK